MATRDQALEQMLNAGMPELPPGHPQFNTSRIIRYGPKKRAWYRLYEFAGKNGRYYVAGAFGMWGAIDATKIESDFAGMDAAERERIEAAQRAMEEQERRKRDARARNAALRARKQWLSAQPAAPDAEAYLKRKGVTPEKGLKFFADGTVLVPMLRYDAEKPRLVGLQKIAADGTKRFNAGMAKEGAACRIGAKPADGAAIIIAEGLATALSIRMGTGKRAPVFIGFDCYNVKPVAAILRKLYPKSPILICADDDFQTEDNPGAACARRAAEAIGNASVLVPVFRERGENKWTDFNDLHQAEGLDAVGLQVHAALDALGAAGGPSKPKPQKPQRPVDWHNLYERFTFIYPTDTAWDAELGEIVKVSNMRLHFGKHVIDHWLASADRKTVNLIDVVFDPAGTADPKRTVNLFRGMPIKPSLKGSCRKLIELLQFLCGEAGQDQAPVTDWVLKWIAYPLQHLGAKMQTAIVMHGMAEGTGKNLFWGAVREIYGRYGALITQTELESPYNAWMSQRLFMIANEVISRQELRHHVGRLKNMITESPLPISEKYLPTRYEDNHMNMVFLTNEIHALQISPNDRRYMVIRTPNVNTREFYEEVVAEIEAGGVAAFYQFLLDLELGDFTEHTKPIITSAKEDLIEIGLSSAQQFWRELQQGLLSPLFYGPCLSNDLFTAYTVWCARNGIKNPRPSNYFSHEFMAMNGVTRKLDRVIDPDKPMAGAQQRMVFRMGHCSEAERESDWVKRCVDEWRTALKDYVRDGSLRRAARNSAEDPNEHGQSY